METTPTVGEFQIEVLFKDEATLEQRNEYAQKHITEIMKALENGPHDDLPDFVTAITIRRTQ